MKCQQQKEGGIRAEKMDGLFCFQQFLSKIGKMALNGIFIDDGRWNRCWLSVNSYSSSSFAISMDEVDQIVSPNGMVPSGCWSAMVECQFHEWSVEPEQK
jgi:hypothetical protein